MTTTKVKETHLDEHYIETMTSILEKINERKSELGLSQRDLEKLTGLKQPAISRLNNINVAPRLDTLIKVLQPLGLKLTLVPIEEK